MKERPFKVGDLFRCNCCAKKCRTAVWEIYEVSYECPPEHGIIGTDPLNRKEGPMGSFSLKYVELLNSDEIKEFVEKNLVDLL